MKPSPRGRLRRKPPSPLWRCSLLSSTTHGRWAGCPAAFPCAATTRSGAASQHPGFATDAVGALGVPAAPWLMSQAPQHFMAIGAAAGSGRAETPPSIDWREQRRHSVDAWRSSCRIELTARALVRHGRPAGVLDPVHEQPLTCVHGHRNSSTSMPACLRRARSVPSGVLPGWFTSGCSDGSMR